MPRGAFPGKAPLPPAAYGSLCPWKAQHLAHSRCQFNALSHRFQETGRRRECSAMRFQFLPPEGRHAQQLERWPSGREQVGRAGPLGTQRPGLQTRKARRAGLGLAWGLGHLCTCPACFSLSSRVLFLLPLLSLLSSLPGSFGPDTFSL